MPCLMHSRVRFDLLAARVGCWLLLILLPTNTPRSLCAGLLSAHSSPSLHLCLTLLHPRCRIQHLDLLDFIPLMTVQCSHLSRSLCKASCPSREWTAPPSLVWLSNLLMVHSTPASRQLINVLNRTGPKTEPWGTLEADSGSLFSRFGRGWDYFLSFWRNHTGRSNVDSTSLAYLVTNISLNSDCSTSSVLFLRIWAKINLCDGHWVLKSVFEGFCCCLFFNLPLHRLSQQCYSWSLTATSWAFRMAHSTSYS